MAADGGGIIGTPGHSPALKYEIQLAELAKRRGMTPERIDLCFSVFDEILPQLGIFQRIAKMLKNELYNAVYSNEYTTGIGSRRSSGATSRVPFFIVAKKIMLERDKVVNKLKVQIESLKEQLYNCEADLEKVSSALETAKFDLRESDAKIHVMTIQNHQINEKNNQLQQKMSKYEDVQRESVEKGNMQRTELQESIKSLETQVEDLTPYKSTHLHIDEVFSLKCNEKTSPEELSIKEKLEMNKGRCDVLKDQLLAMRNRFIDEYEMALITATGMKQNKKELKSCQDKFKLNIEVIEKEISLLTVHEHAISNRLSCVSSVDESLPHLAIIQPDHPLSPVISQEQTLNKYSAQLHISNDDGSSFYFCKESRLCLSCGQKVLICPHWIGNELIIQLPLNSTHIKLTRPLALSHITTTKMTHEQTSNKQLKETTQLEDPDFNRIWKDFALYSDNFDTSLPRDIPISTLEFIIKLFFASQLRLDHSLLVESNNFIIKSFYTFMKYQYCIKQIALSVTHDVISSIYHHYHQHTVVYLFGHILGGTLDGVVFRYYLLMADFIDYIPCTHSEDTFIQWGRVVYPFIEEENLEQLRIEYISYSHNQQTKQHLLDYILKLLIKGREPMILHMESLISENVTISTGCMNENEFAELVLSLYPSSNVDVLAVRLYGQSLAQLKNEGRKDDTLPFRTLAYILSYIHIHCLSSEIYLQLYSIDASHNEDDKDKLIITLKDIKTLM